MMFKKAVRGMLPRKTRRGEIAMSKLTVLDGVPQPFNTKKKQVLPRALRVGNLTKGRDFYVLGDLAA
jgi:large subunit ribosomal protein L13Ae